MTFNQWLKILTLFSLLIGIFAAHAVQPTPANAGKPQTSNVYGPLGCALNVDCELFGVSQLERTPNGASMTLRTTRLDAGAAYTIWWVIFNNPEACDDGCDGADLAKPAVLGTVLYATGHVVGSDGVGNFSARLTEGDISGDSFPFDLPGDTVGLVDATKAEIHLVARTHGQPIPGKVDEQIRTFGGGCPPNECIDQQFAVHLP